MNSSPAFGSLTHLSLSTASFVGPPWHRLVITSHSLKLIHSSIIQSKWKVEGVTTVARIVWFSRGIVRENWARGRGVMGFQSLFLQFLLEANLITYTQALVWYDRKPKSWSRNFLKKVVDLHDATLINVFFPFPTWKWFLRFQKITILLRWFGAIKDLQAVSDPFDPTNPQLLTSSLMYVSSLWARPVARKQFLPCLL